MKILSILILSAMACGAAQPKGGTFHLKARIPVTNSYPIRAKLVGDPGFNYELEQSFQAFAGNLFVRMVNVGERSNPMVGDPSTWPKPDRVNYTFSQSYTTNTPIVHDAAMSVTCKVKDLPKWLYLWELWESVPGQDVPPGTPIAQGKTVKAVGTPPMPVQARKGPPLKAH